MIVTDTASYSDIVFGLLTLAGYTYAPQLADLPDQKLWRIDTRADYGPFTTAARGRIDLDRIRRHWEDILRVVASIHTGAVRAHDVIRMLSRDGHPTRWVRRSRTAGSTDAACCGWSTTPATAATSSQANLQEAPLGGGSSRPRAANYASATTKAWKTNSAPWASSSTRSCSPLPGCRHHGHRAGGYEVHDEDAARLSPFVRHINMLGRHSFLPADLAQGLRPLRDPSGPTRTTTVTPRSGWQNR